MYQRVIIAVADGARDDLMKRLLAEGRLPNIKKHIVDRGCYRTALTVFPSTTGPAHIPFVTGLHPGTANVPGYRWLCRQTHDRHRRSMYRHRSLNSFRGLMVGRDMDPEKSTSLFEYFDRPSSVLELIDYCSNKPLYKIIARRLFRIVQAHKSNDWSKVDSMVERVIIQRILAGSECIVGSFFGIDEYSHLYDPFDPRTIAAYENIDRSVGNIVATLQSKGVYDQTIFAIVSDHGLSATHTHIALVDITREHGFTPHFYPKLYRRRCDSAVLESGNAMAHIYFKRGERWGAHWKQEEFSADPRIEKLVNTLVNTEGITFVAARAEQESVVFIGPHGSLKATRKSEGYDISLVGANPLGEHPLGVSDGGVGKFSSEQLFEMTYHDTYPDAVNQLFLLFSSPRSGDLAVSCEPGFDLRLQYEHPEHFSSHGSLHSEHMHVPLMVNLPLEAERVYNYDLVPTILAQCGKQPRKRMDGRALAVRASAAAPAIAVDDEKPKDGNGVMSVLITVLIILGGLIVTAIFKEEIVGFGDHLMTAYGRTWVDVVLLGLTAVSSSPLALPIWAYTLVGVQMGLSVWRLAAVMALGSATGSTTTFLLGRFFGNRAWVKRRFPNLAKHLWTTGKSRRVVSAILFFGTVSPIPCDILYVACGAKRYPILLFWINMIAARFVRYVYMGYAFKYFGDFVSEYF